ncbi:hypothetical protein HYW68_01435 [Candidatus Parcubacteria bacterium]|nr:hypothetical protein [Candidatus Parcubacteria bacterium]
MTTWSERQWWHWAVSVGTLCGLLLAVIGGAAGGLGTISGSAISGFPVHSWALRLLAGTGLLGGAVGALWVLVRAAILPERTFYPLGNEALALRDLTGSIIKVGLKKVQLKPWPFRMRWAVKSYPTAFTFAAALNPITTNPKVIPLAVAMKVELAAHGDLPHWFLVYLEDPNAAANEFRRVAFEAFQHRLPQELAGRLNPFDGHSVEMLKGFVADELSLLPFRHSVRELSLAMTN